MLGNIAVPRVTIKADSVFDAGGIGTRQEAVGLVNGVLREIAALRRRRSSRHGVAEQVEELEGHPPAKAPLGFELKAGEVRIPELAVNADVSVRGLVVGTASGAREFASRQRQTGGGIPDVVAYRVPVEQLHHFQITSSSTDKAGADDRVLEELMLDGEVIFVGSGS